MVSTDRSYQGVSPHDVWYAVLGTPGYTAPPSGTTCITSASTRSSTRLLSLNKLLNDVQIIIPNIRDQLSNPQNLLHSTLTAVNNLSQHFRQEPSNLSAFVRRHADYFLPNHVFFPKEWDKGSSPLRRSDLLPVLVRFFFFLLFFILNVFSQRAIILLLSC